jgi:hypothetical protein
MKRLIQLPRLPEINPLPVMMQVFNELTAAFKDYNCQIKIVNSLNELEDDGIIFLDDSAGHYINNKDIYLEMGKKCPNSIFICWYWRDFSFQPFKYMIYTGEHHLKQHMNEYMSHPKFVPLKLRANDSPQNIGKYDRNVQRDYCFMGGGYKMDWVPNEFSGIYHRVIYDNYLSYNERRTIYLSSMFALAFQSDENIKTGHLSQRIFEGLAYGCITLCENKLAEEITDGAVIYIASKADLIHKMRFYINNPELIKEKQEQGYEWIKKYGTNRISIQLFLEKIKQLYNKEFTESKDKQLIIPKMHDTFLEDVKGQIEQKTVSGNELTLKGWTFNEQIGVCPIRCKYDGSTKNVTIQSRPDIVEKFNRKNLMLSGWTISVPLNKYCDMQIKIGTDWKSFTSFNSGNNPKPEEVPQPTKSAESTKSNESKPQNEIVQNTPSSDQPAKLDKYINDALADFFKKYPDISPTNTKINKVIIDINKQMPRQVYIYDNFYNNVDEIRHFALDNIANKGIMSNFVKNMAGYKELFEQIMGVKLSLFNKYEYNGEVTHSVAGDSIIINTGESQYSAVLFLTPNAPVNTGITLYRSKHTGKMTISESEKDKVFKNGNQDTTEFEPVDIIGNVYNRLVIFNNKFIHAISHNFGNTLTNCRLVQTFAFDLDESDTTKISFNM